MNDFDALQITDYSVFPSGTWTFQVGMGEHSEEMQVTTPATLTGCEATRLGWEEAVVKFAGQIVHAVRPTLSPNGYQYRYAQGLGS